MQRSVGLGATAAAPTSSAAHCVACARRISRDNAAGVAVASASTRARASGGTLAYANAAPASWRYRSVEREFAMCRRDNLALSRPPVRSACVAPPDRNPEGVRRSKPRRRLKISPIESAARDTSSRRCALSAATPRGAPPRARLRPQRRFSRVGASPRRTSCSSSRPEYE